MIQHYLKIAFRNLFWHKAQNVISILGIAIGFTAFLLGGYWYYLEHSFDTFHPYSFILFALLLLIGILCKDDDRFATVHTACYARCIAILFPQ